MDRDAIETYLTLGLQFFERFKEPPMLDDAEGRVVQLIQINVIRPKPLQALLYCIGQMCVSKIQPGRDVIEVTASFGGDNNPVPVSF